MLLACSLIIIIIYYVQHFMWKLLFGWGHVYIGIGSVCGIEHLNQYTKYFK